MELPQLGKHCHVCKQLDFLPFTCRACGNVFCAEHKELISHGCSIKFDRLQPSCPLCGQVIIVKKGENPDHVVSSHIDRGCPQEEKEQSKMFPCTLAGCKQRELTFIACPGCDKGFCVHHRQPDQHACPSLAKSESATEKADRLKWWWEQVRKIQNGLDVKRLQSNDPRARQITVMKNKGKASGSAKVSENDRIYLEVLYPFDSSLPPKWLFFNKNQPAGRILDEIAADAKIKNENNKPGARKLVLVDLKSGDLIPLSTILRTILSDSDIIMLDFEDSYLANKTKKS